MRATVRAGHDAKAALEDLREALEADKEILPVECLPAILEATPELEPLKKTDEFRRILEEARARAKR